MRIQWQWMGAGLALMLGACEDGIGSDADAARDAQTTNAGREDARPTDGAVADARTDAAVDASLRDAGDPPADRGVDLGTEDAGILDAALDAAPGDAAPVDAAPVDAEPLDAEPLDAAPADADGVDARPTDAAADACVEADERCDGLDNDCDDQVDEALTMACGSNQGRCMAGISTCSAGVWGVCVGGAVPIPEQCNGLDDDCDGEPDNIPAVPAVPLRTGGSPRAVQTANGTVALISVGNGGLALQPLDGQGAARGPAFPVTDRAYGWPDVTWDGAHLVTAFLADDGLWLARHDLAGTAIDRRLLGGERTQEEWVSVVAVPGGYLAVLAGSAGSPLLFAADEHLALRAAPRYQAPGMRRPTLASDGARAILAWNDSALRAIQFTRLDPLGAPLQPDLRLSVSRFTPEGGPSITVAAGGFAIAWSQFEAGPASHLGFARISAAGQVVDGPRSLLGPVPGDPTQPSLISTEAGLFVAWSSGARAERTLQLSTLSAQGAFLAPDRAFGPEQIIDTGEALAPAADGMVLASYDNGQFVVRAGALAGCPVAAPPMLQPGAACDAAGVVNQCDPRGGPCTMAGQCPLATAPVIGAAHLALNPRAGRVEFAVDGRDAEGDVLAATFTPADSGGALLGPTRDSSPLRRAAALAGADTFGGVIEAWPAAADHAWITVVDAFGLSSEPFLAAVTFAPERPVDAVCDPAGEADWCTAGTRCWDNQFADFSFDSPRCVPVPEDCDPDGWIVDLNRHPEADIEEDGPSEGWSTYVSTARPTFGPHLSGPDCGPPPTGAFADRLFAFVAPVAGTYGFETTPATDVARVVEIRRGCGASVAEGRLACSEERAVADLGEGERVIVAVRAFERPDGADDTFQLRVFPPEPVGRIDAVQALFDPVTGLLGLDIMGRTPTPGTFHVGIELLDANGVVMPEAVYRGFELPVTDLDLSDDTFHARLAVPLFADSPPRPDSGRPEDARLVRLHLRTFDPRRLRARGIGPPHESPLVAAPRLVAGDVCTPDGGLGLCPARHACQVDDPAQSPLGRCVAVDLPAGSTCPAAWAGFSTDLGGEFIAGGVPDPALQPSPCGGMGATSVIRYTARQSGTLVVEATGNGERFPIPMVSLQRTCNDPGFEHLLGCGLLAPHSDYVQARAATRVTAGDVVYIHVDHVAPSRRQSYLLRAHIYVD